MNFLTYDIYRDYHTSDNEHSFDIVSNNETHSTVSMANCATLNMQQLILSSTIRYFTRSTKLFTTQVFLG